MGNGSTHGKDSHVTETPPVGARVVGEGGKIEQYEGNDKVPASDPASSDKKKEEAKSV